jgi:peptidoglycan-associated lipoprotein
MRKTILLALAAVALVGSGCASKKYVRKEQETTNRRIDSVEQSVEEVETRTKQNEEAIASTQEDLSKTKTDVKSVGAEAEEAHRLAKGKLLYQGVLNNYAIRFATDKAELTDTGIVVVKDLLTKLKNDNQNVYIEIQGHTDNTGDSKYNYELGLMRAEAVRRYMAGEGIPLHKLGVISYGETMPVADNGTPDGRSQNRRVVILVRE